jgi:hypothetical protein
MTACSRVIGAAVTAATLLGAVATMSVHVSAQPTQPVYVQYDGFVKNKNGTLTFSFGYFNMNNVDVTVPPGDGNRWSLVVGHSSDQ